MKEALFLQEERGSVRREGAGPAPEEVWAMGCGHQWLPYLEGDSLYLSEARSQAPAVSSAWRAESST